MAPHKNQWQKWLVLALLLCSQVGCQFLGELPSETPINNTPPMILVAEIKEPTLEKKFVIEKTLHPNGFTTFKVPWAFDPDYDDTMHGYWLLDHDITPQFSYLDRAKETKPTSGFDPFRKREINFTLNLLHAHPRLKVGQQSILSFYLTDKEVEPLIFQTPTNGTSGTIKWPKNVGYDRISWTLQVE